MIAYKTASTSDELQQILSLQQRNLPEVISSEEKRKEGFVTVHHDLDILRRMNDACPHILAKNDESVVGYALCMHPKFGNEIKILKPMFKEINSLPEPIKSYLIMGQICIDKPFRGQGIFRKLYETMREAIKPEFQTIITEVDVSNTRSLNAHYAIGFKTLSTYEADNRYWELIAMK